MKWPQGKQISQVHDAVVAKRQAQDMKCECTGFALQYQGCTCERGNKMEEAEKNLQSILHQIGGGK